MNISSVTQSSLYGLTSASQMLQTTSSESSSYEELQSAEELVAQDDTDADGQLSIDETPLTEDMFSTADEDGDGYLTQEELEAYLESGPGSANIQAPAMDVASILEQEDEDEDGVLSLEETTLTQEMFETADSDSDGYISSEELEEYLDSGQQNTAGAGGAPPGGMPPEEDEDEEETSISAADAFAISTYESVSANFMSIMTGDTESYTNNFFSGVVV